MIGIGSLYCSRIVELFLVDFLVRSCIHIYFKIPQIEALASINS